MLKRVSIQNFKSLKDVTLDLQKVNLLIGPNNSGKTNFLKALEFVGRWINNQYINELEVKYFVNKTSRQNDAYFTFSDHFYDEKADDIQLYNYTLKVGTNVIFDNIRYEEYIRIGEGKNEDVSHSKWYLMPKELHIDGRVVENIDPLPSKFISLKYKQVDIATVLFDTFKNNTVYRPDPNKLNKPAPVGRGEDFITADASNLIAFFDRIRDEYPASFAQIKADLAKCVPEFTEINFQNVESTEELIKQFGDKTFKRIGLTDGRQKTIYWADELSEGTLYFIALLCIINQPNPPKLLLLEEPEKGIHPRRIREVMDFIFRLAEEKDVQIILTSHNEHVLDDFSTRPESVFVFDKDEEGATYVRNLQKDIIEPANQRNRELGLDDVDLTTNLSENWLYGLLGGVPAIP